MPKLQGTPRGLLKRSRTVFKPVFSVTRRDFSGKKVSTVNLNTGVKRITVDLDPQFIWTPSSLKREVGSARGCGYAAPFCRTHLSL